MKEFNFKFRGDLELEGAEETFLDALCELVESNTKEISYTSSVSDSYKNFTAKMDNGVELDCEVAWSNESNGWDATAWQMD